mgnify:CR=1 FL=1
MPKKRWLSDEQRNENRKLAQENYRHRVRRFTFQFSLKDTEAWEWFEAQPDKGKYLKELILADKQQQLQKQQENETNEILLAEDAVQTSVYIANAPDCCSGAEQLDHVLGMLGADVMDEDVYHSEDQHPRLCMK